MAFVSGNLDAEKVEMSRLAGVNSAMTKPFTMGNLKTHMLGLMTDNPVFVKSPSYFGPDRRRSQTEYKGEERRNIASIPVEKEG